MLIVVGSSNGSSGSSSITSNSNSDELSCNCIDSSRVESSALSKGKSRGEERKVEDSSTG